jgi:hypothetical protein
MSPKAPHVIKKAPHMLQVMLHQSHMDSDLTIAVLVAVVEARAVYTSESTMVTLDILIGLIAMIAQCILIIGHIIDHREDIMDMTTDMIVDKFSTK